MTRRVHTRADFDELLRTATNYERMPEFHAGRVRFDLDRMRAYARRLGHPERAAPVVHVTGTKGKGTTATLAARILGFVARPVGLHTSPHLERMEERVRVDGRELDEGALLRHTDEVLAAQVDGDDLGFPTYFELMTLIALLRFRAAGVRFAVHEVGLGGRLDATNIVEPCATAITNVALEHVHVLGGSLEAIADEKSGIVKPGVPVVTGVPRESPAYDVIAGRAAEVGATLLRLGHEVRVATTPREGGILVDVETERAAYRGLRPSVLGARMGENVAVAVALAEIAADETGCGPLDPDVVRAALLGVSLPARTEVIPGRPPVVLDGGHTAESIGYALGEVRRAWPGRRVGCLFALASDKNPEECGRGLSGADFVVVTRYEHPRASDPHRLAAALPASVGEVHVVKRWEFALDQALKMAEEQNPVLIVGSLYLAGSARGRLLTRR